MNNYNDITKFEFLLTLDGNIICQRYFNVKNFNPYARRSMDLHYAVKNICNIISEDLKIKSSDYLVENQNFLLNSENVEPNVPNSDEYFVVEIKMGDDVFIQRMFPAQYYHPKVRYTVDVRPRIKNILTQLTEVLSADELATSYLQYELV